MRGEADDGFYDLYIVPSSDLVAEFDVREILKHEDEAGALGIGRAVVAARRAHRRWSAKDS
jgi:hypothetical protein